MLKEQDTLLNKKLTGILVEQSHIVSEQKDKEVSLHTLYAAKPLIIFFYPKDMTPGCTIEVQRFNNIYPRLQEKNFNLVGCSKDDENKHCKFIKKHGLNYPLLYDHTSEITESFGVWEQQSFMGKKYMGITRATFIVYQHKIIKVYPKVKPTSHCNDLLKDIEHLNF